MSEYKVIPSNPDYEITREGQIRFVHNQEVVEAYIGRASITEPKHRRVRLLDERSYPLAHRVEDLLVETFEDYVRPEKPVEVKEPVKKQKKNLADRDTKHTVPPASRIKDPDKEWRVIPGFENYEITRDGEVWSKIRGQKLSMYTSSKNVSSYHMYTNPGTKTNRSVKKLLALAYPELAPKKPEKPQKLRRGRKVRARGSWHDVPGFERYQISKDGGLRYKSNKQVVCSDPNATVRMTGEMSIKELLERTFRKDAA